MAGLTLISIISIGLVLAIITLHILAAGVTGLRFSRPTSLLVLVILSLVTYGILWAVQIPVTLWVGFSPPYGWTAEKEVLRLTFGIHYPWTLMEVLGANIGYAVCQSLDLPLGVSLLFLLGLAPTLLVKPAIATRLI